MSLSASSTGRSCSSSAASGANSAGGAGLSGAGGSAGVGGILTGVGGSVLMRASAVLSARTSPSKRTLQTGVCTVASPSHALQPGVIPYFMIRSSVIYSCLFAGAESGLRGLKGTSKPFMSGNLGSANPSRARSKADRIGNTSSPSGTNNSSKGTEMAKSNPATPSLTLR